MLRPILLICLACGCGTAGVPDGTSPRTHDSDSEDRQDDDGDAELELGDDDGPTGDADTGNGDTDPGEHVSQTLAGYTATGANNASWGGSGAPDTLVSNGSGYLPMAHSDCPKDPDMQVAEPYLDKIFNGCLDECEGDANNWGHGIATIFDWNHSSGWAVAQLYSNLHHTGMWPPSEGDEPLTLVFWILGAAGGEQARFTVAVRSSSGTDSTALTIPVTVTTYWQRVVIPFADFNATGTSVGLTFVATGSGPTLFAIDQAYLSKTVPVP